MECADDVPLRTVLLGGGILYDNLERYHQTRKDNPFYVKL